MATRGYSGYKGRKSPWKIVAAILLVLVILAAAAVVMYQLVLWVEKILNRFWGKGS